MFSLTDHTVSILGLGKLGSPMAACIAAAGFNVIAMDTDPRKVEAINQLQPPVNETDLADKLTSCKDRLRGVHDPIEAVLKSDITFIITPTPSQADGSFSLKFVLPACRSIGSALRIKSRPHLVVISSTVMPGSTMGAIRAMLEESSGRTLGPELGLCYSPEFIALGSVIRDYLNPDFVLIGESDAPWGDLLQSVYQQVCENQPRFARMSPVNAEICKIAVNSYVTTKITFANMIAGICQQTPDADVDVVTQALGMDSRIGAKYLKGAVAFGGPCFPRDNRALAQHAQSVGASAELARTVDHSNQLESQKLIALLLTHLNKPLEESTLSILGLAYKPNTEVVEQSQGLWLAEHLAKLGCKVLAHDPMGNASARQLLGDKLTVCDHLPDALANADALVLVTPWRDYRVLPSLIAKRESPLLLIDCWRMFDAKLWPTCVNYLAVGRGPNTKTNSINPTSHLLATNPNEPRPPLRLRVA